MAERERLRRLERLRELVANDYDPNAPEYNTLESFLLLIGEFGLSQRITIFALLIPALFVSFQTISYLFTASPVVHRCYISECDTPKTGFSEPFIYFSIPHYQDKMDQCHRYAFYNVSSPNCNADNFLRTVTDECIDGYIFRDVNEYTLTKKFQLFCSREEKRVMIGFINNVGQLIGLPLGGIFADRFGRRAAFLTAVCICLPIGALRAFVNSYKVFLVFEFITGFMGSIVLPAAFILAIELVRPKRRMGVATIIAISYPLSELLLGITVKLLNEFHIIFLLPLFIVSFTLFSFLSINESLHWLMSRGREDKALKILSLIALRNSRRCDLERITVLMDCNIYRVYLANESNYPIWRAIKEFKLRIVLCCFLWITLTLASLSVHSSSFHFSDTKHGELLYNGSIQIAALAFPYFMMKFTDRRLSLRCSMLSYTLFVFGTIFLGSFPPLKFMFYSAGKIATTCSLHILYLFTSEMFPTKVRSSILGLCLMFGRIGYLVAPIVFSLSKLFEFAPHLLILGFVFFGASNTFRLPETLNERLPASVQEAADLRFDREE